MQLPIAEPMFASGAVTIDLNLTVLAHMVLFVAFATILKPLIFDPLLRVFEERERRTVGAKDMAREIDERAIEAKHEFDSKMDEVRREAAGAREQVRGETMKLQGDMMHGAREAADATLDKGMGGIEAEVKRIRDDLRGQQPALAAQIASRVLGREVAK
jgi:F-type H+-transporting ATPase subunit b